MSALDEVVRQHEFIEAWLAGTAPRGGPGWRAFEESLDDRFVIVSPSGVVQPKSELVEGFEGAYGAMPGVQIEIRNGVSVYATDEIEVVRYEEWQLHAELGNQRVSTAVFVAEPSAPLGWAWLTLHESPLSA